MTKDVAKQDAVPVYLQGAEDAPTFNPDELEIPRLMLTQSMTPQRKKTDPNCIPGLEEGQYFNSVTGEIYGEDVSVTVLKVYESRIKFYPTDSAESGVECSSPDSLSGGVLSDSCGACPHGQWDGKRPPTCNLQSNFLLLVNGAPILMNFKSTGLKIARNWKTQLAVAGVAYYGMNWLLTSVSATSKNGDYFITRVARDGYNTEETVTLAKPLYDQFKDQQVGGRGDAAPTEAPAVSSKY